MDQTFEAVIDGAGVFDQMIDGEAVKVGNVFIQVPMSEGEVSGVRDEVFKFREAEGLEFVRRLMEFQRTQAGNAPFRAQVTCGMVFGRTGREYRLKKWEPIRPAKAA